MRINGLKEPSATSRYAKRLAGEILHWKQKFADSTNVRFRPIADVKLCRDIALMADDFPRRLKIAVGASLATSGVLGLWTFVFTDVTAGPIIFINWCFFGMATYLLIFPIPRLGTVSPDVLMRLKAWLLVFLSYTVAGWFTLIRTGHPL